VQRWPLPARHQRGQRGRRLAQTLAAALAFDPVALTVDLLLIPFWRGCILLDISILAVVLHQTANHRLYDKHLLFGWDRRSQE